MDASEHRKWYARLITANAGVVGDERLYGAFATVPREVFLGPGPWSVFTRAGYIETPSDDPAFVYQDIVIALKKEARLNKGQPTLHATCIAALGVREGNTVVHVGAGTGYYTAILARLAQRTGHVTAYEIDTELAGRAKENLASYDNVRVANASGVAAALPACDVLYVNAAAISPPATWFDALKPGGRLLFPLASGEAPGVMLLITHAGDDPAADAFTARFITPVMFTPCVGAEDHEAARAFAKAFSGGGMQNVRSLRRGTLPDETCWFAGATWWLSTAPP
jgi:protein-L-isoaspartate(D-aspartate) O-methyltransferase